MEKGFAVRITPFTLLEYHALKSFHADFHKCIILGGFCVPFCVRTETAHGEKR